MKQRTGGKKNETRQNCNKKGAVLKKSKNMSSPSIETKVEKVINLQRTIGNKAVTGLFNSGAIQAKLENNSTTDRGKQEARLLLDQVQPILEPIQRQVYGDEPAGFHNPEAIIPIADFIGYVEEVERAYPDDTPAEIVTRIRQLYYSGTAFEQLISRAHTHDYRVVMGPMGESMIVSTPRKVSRHRISAEAYSHLTARADENMPGRGDNPSPYIRLANGEDLDVGHLLLGLDALVHPGSGIPYTTFEVPTIDPASWVADIGIAAVWMTQHEEGGEPPDNVPVRLERPNLDAYYRMSAPIQDLIGDVDSFGLHRTWTSEEGQSLSTVLRKYYLGTGDTQAEVNRRFQTFCEANGFTYTRNGNTVTWASNLRQQLIGRVNRFNDLFASGTLGSAVAVAIGPTRREWPHTPAVVDRFLEWVKTNLEAELSKNR